MSESDTVVSKCAVRALMETDFEREEAYQRAERILARTTKKIVGFGELQNLFTVIDNKLDVYRILKTRANQISLINKKAS